MRGAKVPGMVGKVLFVFFTLPYFLFLAGARNCTSFMWPPRKAGWSRHIPILTGAYYGHYHLKSPVIDQAILERS